MFDDQVTSAPTPPSNLPVEPDDIFQELEKTPEVPTKPNALDSGLLKPKTETRANPAPAPARTEHAAPARSPESSVVVPPSIELMGRQGETIAPVSNPILGKILLTVLIFIIVGGGAFGGWWVYLNVIQKKAVTTPPPATSVQTETTPTPPPTTPVTQPIQNEPENPVVVDSDSDGLPDSQENALGTDPAKADTDGDGVSDGDEVLKYHTNPLKADTDGDGYSDGTEINNGYNPNGPGKLSTNPATSSAPSANESLPPMERNRQPAASSTLPPAVDL